MARKVLTMNRYESILNRLNANESVRSIARNLGCDRALVREIRDGKRLDPLTQKEEQAPDWAFCIQWSKIQDEVKLGAELKRLWETHSKHLIGYDTFRRRFFKLYPEFKKNFKTLREFEPGERCEVDYSGKKITWYNPKSKRFERADVFIGILGFSQIIFATAKQDQKSSRFLNCHNEMFAFFGGVPESTVSDCLKQGVRQPDTFDPDLNPAYEDLSNHYGTRIVPTRTYKPKDKALVEGGVKIVMRLFQFKNRDRKFTSLKQINDALREVIDEINHRNHARFKVSRFERWRQIELKHLKTLPDQKYEPADFKTVRLHPDCHVQVGSNFYSAPHHLRGKKLQVKITEKLIQIFDEAKQVASHPRETQKIGKRIADTVHFPENAKAYREGTPQSILQQSRFVHPKLHELLEAMFQENTYGNLRIAQGLLQAARKEKKELGEEKGNHNLEKAIDQIRRFNKVRVPYLKDCLKQLRKKDFRREEAEQRKVKRNPHNPMLRHNKDTRQGKLFLVENHNNETKGGPQ